MTCVSPELSGELLTLGLAAMIGAAVAADTYLKSRQISKGVHRLDEIERFSLRRFGVWWAVRVAVFASIALYLAIARLNPVAAIAPLAVVLMSLCKTLRRPERRRRERAPVAAPKSPA